MVFVWMLIVSTFAVGASVFMKFHFIENPLPGSIGLRAAKSIFGDGMFSPHAWFAAVCTFGFAVGWAYVINKAPLSVVYPLSSISYVLMLGATYFLLNEPVTVNKLVGTGFIVVGIWFVTR